MATPLNYHDDSTPGGKMVFPATLPKPMSLHETAAFFGVTRRTLLRWMEKRLISYVKVGAATNARVFFFPEDIAAMATRLRRNAVAQPV